MANPNPRRVTRSKTPPETAPAIEHTTIAAAAQGPQGLIDPESIVLAKDAHGQDLTLNDVTRKDLHIFMAIYFCLTGLHGIHVLAGMVVILWLIVGTARGRYNREYHTPIPIGGLYWHLVDLIWIFLFPLLYPDPLTPARPFAQRRFE